MQSLLRWVLDHPMPEFRLSRADLPENLLNLLEALLQPDPSRRPGSAAEALARLEVDAPRRTNSQSTERVGPWVLGDLLRSRRFSEVYSVFHFRSGINADLAWEIQPNKTPSQVRAAAMERAAALNHPASLAYSTGGSSRGAPTR